MESDCDPPGVAVVRRKDLTVVARYQAMLRACGLDSLEALFGGLDFELLSKPGLEPWRERFRLTLEHEGLRRTLYLKRFIEPPASARRTVRASRTGASSLAGMEWAWMNRLRRDRIGCAEPVAFGEELDGARERRSAILTAAVPGRSLETWVSLWSEDDRATVRGLLAPLADLVSRLHRLGYVHRDLYLSHVFWDSARPTDGSPASVDGPLALIDLQRVIRPRGLVMRWTVKDLAALNFSTPAGVATAADRIRWLKCYLGVPKLDGRGKRLAYRVIGKTLRIARHERRRMAKFR